MSYLYIFLPLHSVISLLPRTILCNFSPQKTPVTYPNVIPHLFEATRTAQRATLLVAWRESPAFVRDDVPDAIVEGSARSWVKDLID